MYQSYLILLFFIHYQLSSQENYFQQEVNYKIDVKLDDVKHKLRAFEKLEYINNSLVPLNFIYFHLWPNAYKNSETALGEQLLENGETSLYFAKSSDLGYIDSLNFLVNGEIVKWEYDKKHIDICKLILNKPINPKDTIVISTPFVVQLPSGKISRLGHIDQAYAITQWYPKPAVFDREGWHPMPYLNQGEFFSEFGSFEVNITLPKNYVLAATGDRIDEPEEEEWLASKVAETKKMIAYNNFSHDMSIPPSSEELKTITFKQYRIHDFAWFADKRFHVLNDEILIPLSGKRVNTWAYFTNNEPELWSKSLEYINDATYFYSALNGDYPYNHVTAVDGTISAGGGMEYPNITIIGKSGNDFTLETTIMHEVGHNWFYGILGSNERDYPFLDEGLNTFYEMRYIRNKYPEKKLTSIINRDSTFRFFGLNKFSHKAQYEFSYLLAARKNTDQAIEISSDKFTKYNYGAIVYSKTALAFDYLMNYLGKEKFDEAMKFYFDEWKFKHPSPTDLIKTLQYYLNADLKWFENELLLTNHKLDYKVLAQKTLRDSSHVILVKNNNQLLGPVSVSGFKNGKLVGTVWYNGFYGKRVFEFPPSIVDEFVIDADNYMMEVNRKNNLIRTKGIFKKRNPIQLNFLGKIDNPTYTQLNYLPILGYNKYNKFMLGIAFYNYSFLQKPFEFTLAPMYAFGSKTPTGYADFVKHITQNNNLFQEIRLKGNVKSFSNGIVQTSYFNKVYKLSVKPYNLNYYKISATIDFELKKRNPRNIITEVISYSTNHFFVDQFYVPNSKTVTNLTKKNDHSVINRFQYSLKNNQIINPYGLIFNFDHNDNFGKASLELNYSISFKDKKSLDVRVFAGAFVFGNRIERYPYRFRMSGYTGINDYMFDYNYLGRNEQSGFSFAQFVENDGAFKIWSPIGQTSKWLLAVNLKSPKIGKLPFKFFADIGTSEYNESLKLDRVIYCAGFEICLLKNICEIYFPLFYSADIKEYLILNKRNGFTNTIRFTLNLHNIIPKNLISNNFF